MERSTWYDADVSGHEQVVVAHDPPTGLRAIVAIHSTALGPSLGGTRMRPYPDLGTALRDVLELSRAMTEKNSVTGLDHGGGKAVIIGDPSRDKTPELLRAYGRLVASLGGRYVTACDVGTYVADMDVVAGVNPWTTGRSVERGGAGDSGVLTAVGVHAAMGACAAQVWGTSSLAGRRIGIEGVGKVGARLAGLAVEEGAHVQVADVAAAAVDGLLARYPQVEVRTRDDLLAADLDLLAPCALGGTLTREVIDGLRAAVVCGGANNQLAAPGLDEQLAARGVLYAPEFVANAGGVIAVSDEYLGFDATRALARTRQIAATMTRVLALAAQEGVTPWAAAERLAQDRVDAAVAAHPPYRTFPVPQAIR